MDGNQPSGVSMPLYRVDKLVPAAGRDEFLKRVASTHALLRQQEGFVRDLVMEQQSGPGAFNFSTSSLWSNGRARKSSGTLPPPWSNCTGRWASIGRR